MRRFYEGVSVIPGVTVYGDFTAPRTAVVALNIRDYDSGEVSDALSAGLRHRHPARRPLCPPDAPGLGYGAPGSRAVQLRLVQHGT